MQDVTGHALRLLKFIEDSVTEALSNPSAMLEPLSEADCALRVLQKLLIKEVPSKNAVLMLIGVFDQNFVQITKDNPINPVPKIKTALDDVLRAKEHFNAT
jgi:hypothetical protein